MALADRSAFQRAAERRYAETTIEDFGKVRMRSMSEMEQTELDESRLDKDRNIDPGKLREYIARLMIAVLVNENGEAILGEVDIPMLRKMDFAISDRISDACLSHVRGKSVEDSAKNLPPIGGGGSPSSSQSEPALVLVTS